MYMEMLWEALLQSKTMGRPGGTSKRTVQSSGGLWILDLCHKEIRAVFW